MRKQGKWRTTDAWGQSTVSTNIYDTSVLEEDPYCNITFGNDIAYFEKEIILNRLDQMEKGKIVELDIDGIFCNGICIKTLPEEEEADLCPFLSFTALELIENMLLPIQDNGVYSGHYVEVHDEADSHHD
jgi:hypothetical protein